MRGAWGWATVVVILFRPESAPAGDWTQWRGPTRDGVVAASSVPAAWPESLHRAWRIEVGEGYSSPVVAGDRVFVHSRRDPEEVVTAVSLRDGAVVWTKSYPAAYEKNRYAKPMAKGPNSTPLVAGGRLFTLGATGVLSAWDAQSGALLWRRDYSTSIEMTRLFCGTAASPLLEGGALIVQVGSDVHGGRVLALDPATGAERWVWSGLGPGYASPVAITVGESRQLVTLTQGSVVGIDAGSGATLWSVPFPDEWHENITTPLWTGQHLVVSGTRQGTHAFSLRRDSDGWKAVPAWKNPDVAMYMSSPVLAGGTIYGHSSKRKGQLVAMDSAGGRVRWATEGRGGEHASILLAPAHVLFLTNQAELFVVPRTATSFEPERRYTVADSQTWAMPVPLPDGLIVRDTGGLVKLTWKPGDVAQRAAASLMDLTAR